MDFSNWTREDFLAFDARRAEVFMPTQAELDVQAQQQAEFEAQQLQAKMTMLWLPTWTPITKELALHILQGMNAQQFIGENLEGWIDEQIELFGILDEAFKNFVIKYL